MLRKMRTTVVFILGCVATVTYSSVSFAATAAQTVHITVSDTTPPDTTPPSVPQGLSAVDITDSSVTLNWTTNQEPDLSGYKLYRDNQFLAALSSSQTSYQDTGLLSETTYAYELTGFDLLGNESPRSPPLSVTTSLPPDTEAPTIPTGLTATAISSTQIDLSWTASTDDVAAAGYKIYRDGSLLTTQNSSLTTFSDMGLQPNTTYTYTVSAYDAAGNESGESIQSSAPPPPSIIGSLPQTAEVLFTSGVQAGERRREIYALDTDNGATTQITFGIKNHFITGIDNSRRYIVSSQTEQDTNEPAGLGDEDKRALWIIDLETQREARLTNIENHAEGDSFSPDGEWIVFMMRVSLSEEDQPDIYKIKKDGTELTKLTDTETVIEGDPEFSHGGDKIVFTSFDSLDANPRFVIKMMDSNGQNIQTIYDGGEGVPVGPFPQGSYDPSWSPDDEWIVFEKAIAAGGNWESGIWHIFKVRRDGSGLVDLSENGGHENAAEYLPSFSPDGKSIIFGSLFFNALNPEESHNSIFLMDAGSGWEQRLTMDPTGVGDMYPVFIPNTQDTHAPTIPAGLRTTSVFSSQINLSWTASTDDVGVAGYKIYRDGVLLTSHQSPVTTYSDTGLTASTTYIYTVSALDAAGNESVQSQAVSATTLAPPDTTAPVIAITSPLDQATENRGQITVTGTASDNTGVASVTVNGLSVATTDNYANWTASLALVEGANTINAEVKDLAGNSAAAFITISLDTTPPSIPQGLSQTEITDSSVTLNWTANQEPDLSGYKLYRDNQFLAVLPASQTSYQDTGLLSETAYAYELTSFDLLGNESPRSPPLLVTTLAPPDTEAPTIPTGLTATAISSTQIDLSWTASSDNVGVTGYNIYRDGVLITNHQSPVTSYSDTSLQPNTTYTYAVSAYDAAGNESGQSEAAVSTTAMPYERINIVGENASKGVFDPSLEYDDNGAIWMVYTAVELEEKGNAHFLNLAKSEDGGKTWQFIAKINDSPMGEVTLNGEKIFGNWRNEVATLVDDKDDPNPSKRWKLFWNKYFMKPPFGEGDRVLPYFGWIAYKYASSPEALAQAEEIRLFGNHPFPFNPQNGEPGYPVEYYLNQIDSNLKGFLTFTEPGSLVKDGIIYLSIEGIPSVFEDRRIFLISSKDHGTTWQYNGVLLDKKDAKDLNTPILTASSLFEENGKVFLLASPVTPNGHNGIVVFEFENITEAKLKRNGSGELIVVQRVEPYIEGVFSGAGDYDSKKTYGGIIISSIDILKVKEKKSTNGAFQIFDTKERIISDNVI